MIGNRKSQKTRLFEEKIFTPKKARPLELVPMAAAFPYTSIVVSCGRVKESSAPFNLALQRPLEYPNRADMTTFWGRFFFIFLPFNGQISNWRCHQPDSYNRVLNKFFWKKFLVEPPTGTDSGKIFIRPNPGKNHLKWMWFVDSKLAQFFREMPVFVVVCNFSRLVRLSTMLRIFTRFKNWFKQFI